MITTLAHARTPAHASAPAARPHGATKSFGASGSHPNGHCLYTASGSHPDGAVLTYIQISLYCIGSALQVLRFLAAVFLKRKLAGLHKFIKELAFSVELGF